MNLQATGEFDGWISCQHKAQSICETPKLNFADDISLVLIEIQHQIVLMSEAATTSETSVNLNQNTRRDFMLPQ